MGKLVAGLTVLSLVLLFALIVSNWFSGEINSVEQLIYEASSLVRQGELNDAMDKLKEAKSLWEKTEKVALVFIHGSKSESVNNAFFEYMNALESGEGDAAWLQKKLIYHLRSLVESERLSIKTIL